MEKIFKNRSMTMKFHILNVHEGLGGKMGGVRNLGTEKSVKKTLKKTKIEL